jgi:hypothetical protein
VSQLQRAGELTADRLEGRVDLGAETSHRSDCAECDNRHHERIFDEVLRGLPDVLCRWTS